MPGRGMLQMAGSACSFSTATEFIYSIDFVRYMTRLGEG